MSKPRIKRTANAAAVGTPAGGSSTATITVKFDYNQGTPKWSFASGGNTTGDVEMAQGNDTITVEMSSDSTSGAALSTVNFCDPQPPAGVFSQSVANGVITLLDNDTSATEVEFGYDVTVNYGGTPYTSPDPKIKNDPPATPPTSG